MGGEDGEERKKKKRGKSIANAINIRLALHRERKTYGGKKT